MPSKKTAAAERTNLPRPFACSKAFLKDWARYAKAGRADLHRLKRLMLLLIANEGPLAPEWRDHALTGTWHGVRDAHVHGDFLLLYRITSSPETIIFERIGTHSELF